MSNVICILIILLVIAILYKKSEYKTAKPINNSDISDFFLGNTSIDKIGYCKKPLLWIHCPIEYNARNWQSFGSRSSYELNQIYI